MPGPANALNINEEGVTYFDGSSQFSGIPGVTAGFVLTDNGAGMVPSFQSSVGVSKFPITPFVVGPIGDAGYQTIQAALNAANGAGGGIVYVQPGTYTENLTLYDKTQVVGAVGLADTGDLIIVGVHTPPTSGGFVFRNVTLQSATHIFNSAIAGSAHLIIIDAAIIVTNGYTFNLPNWTGKLESFDVNDRGSTNDGYVNNTGGAEVALFSCAVGAGSGNVMTVSGSTSIFTCAVSAPLNCVTGSSVFLEGNVHLNTITFSNNSTGEIVYSEVDAQITMSSSGAWLISETTINTASNPAIAGSGAGILTLGGITFVSGNNISGTLTLAGATGFLPTVLTNGQLIIGKTNSGAVAGSLTSTGGSITITPGAGTINLETAGGGGGITTLNGDIGSATGSTILVTALGSISGQDCGSSVAFTGSGSTMELDVTDAAGNTFIGRGAGKLNSQASTSVALGVIALRSISTTLGSNSNTAIGYASMNSTVQGVQNTAVGLFSLGSSLGDSNTAIGCQALSSLVGTGGVGDFNTAVGNAAGAGVVSGTLNTFLGYNSGNNYTGSESNNLCIAHPGTTGDNDTIRIGLGSKTACFVAGIAGVTVSNTNMVTINTATGQMGSQAVPGGGGITTINGDSGSISGSTVTIYADNSTQNCGSSVEFVNSGTISILNVTDSSHNTIIGKSAGNATLTGSVSCIYGESAGSSLTTGFNNNFFGFFAGHTVDSGTSNNIFGNSAGQFITTGSDNVLLGQGTGGNLVGGSRNILVGSGSGFNLVSGTDNLSIGNNSGSAYSSSESSNILLTNTGVVGESNVIRIGTQGSGAGQQNACFIAGIDGATVTGSAVLISSSGQLGDIVSSAKVKENIQDIAQTKYSILDCRPVSFNYKSDETKTKCFGLIAEEVEKVFPDLVLYKEGEPYSIKYHEMPALLLAEIQKLRAEIDLLKKRK